MQKCPQWTNSDSLYCKYNNRTGTLHPPWENDHHFFGVFIKVGKCWVSPHIATFSYRNLGAILATLLQYGYLFVSNPCECYYERHCLIWKSIETQIWMKWMLCLQLHKLFQVQTSQRSKKASNTLSVNLSHSFNATRTVKEVRLETYLENQSCTYSILCYNFVAYKRTFIRDDCYGR